MASRKQPSARTPVRVHQAIQYPLAPGLGAGLHPPKHCRFESQAFWYWMYLTGVSRLGYFVQRIDLGADGMGEKEKKEEHGGKEAYQMAQNVCSAPQSIANMNAGPYHQRHRVCHRSE